MNQNSRQKFIVKGRCSIIVAIFCFFLGSIQPNLLGSIKPKSAKQAI